MTESAAGPSGPGTVVLELGADVGALVLYAPADLDGREIDISPDSSFGYTLQSANALYAGHPDEALASAPKVRM